MRTKDFVAVLGLAALVAFCATPLIAQQDPSHGGTAQEAATHHNATEHANHNRVFLGVGVEDVTPALASHLAIPEGEGLLVEHVAPDSPAAKAGIERHDVLLRVGDQKLLSAEQFVKLIHAQKPGEKCSLELMRRGKKENVEVTLGEMPANMMQRPHAEWMRPHREDNGMANAQRQRRGSEWERFDSLSLQKIGNNQFKATIAYLDDQGKVERHEFQGTPLQIHKALATEKNVPRSEREHLYRALNMSESGNLPGVRFIPGEGLVIDFGSIAPEQPSQQQQPAGQEF